jgi:hypothetical protein
MKNSAEDDNYLLNCLAAAFSHKHTADFVIFQLSLSLFSLIGQSSIFSGFPCLIVIRKGMTIVGVL